MLEDISKVKNQGAAIRRRIINLLPSDVPVHNSVHVYNRYEKVCKLTNEVENVSVEHFIPLIWGHGGNVWGNIFPLCKSLNISKKDANPFEWVLLPQISRTLNWQLWERFINFIAAENGLTVEKFIEYVYKP